jgi:hypothetical protein
MDLALVDIKLPDTSGTILIEKMNAINPNLEDCNNGLSIVGRCNRGVGAWSRSISGEACKAGGTCQDYRRKAEKNQRLSPIFVQASINLFISWLDLPLYYYALAFKRNASSSLGFSGIFDETPENIS